MKPRLYLILAPVALAAAIAAGFEHSPTAGFIATAAALSVACWVSRASQND